MERKFGNRDRTPEIKKGVPGGSSKDVERRRPHERYPDSWRDAILTSVLNSEAKMTVLGGMIQEPGFYTSGDLDQMIRDKQRNHDGWPISAGVAHSYCSWSFADIGVVVADEQRDDSTTLAYGVTPRGEDTLSVIGHLQEYSEQRPHISLARLLSTTSTPINAGKIEYDEEAAQGEDDKNRAPKTRLQIIKKILAAEGPMRETDLEEAIGSKYSLTTHLQNLDAQGIISYRSVRSGDTSPVRYNTIEGALDDIDAIPPATDETVFEKRIAFVVSKLEGDIVIGDVYDEIVKLFPHYSDRSPGYIKSRISMKLKNLSEIGLLQKGEVSRENLSSITLTDEQRADLQAFVDIIDGFQEGDPEYIAQGEAKAHAYLNDPSRVASQMRKAQKHSVVAQALTKSAWKSKIATILHEAEGPMTAPQIAELVDNKIGNTYIASLMKEMAKDEEIDVDRRSQAVWYRTRPLIEEENTVEEEPEETKEYVNKGRPVGKHTLAARAQIQAFIDFGITDHKEIGKWIGMRSDYVLKHMQVMEGTENTTLTDSKIGRVLQAQHLRDNAGLTDQEISERMGIDVRTITRYLDIVDSGKLEQQQERETTADKGRALVLELEETFDKDTPVGERVARVMQETGASAASVWAWRSAVLGTPAERIASRREGIRLIIESMPPGTPQKEIVKTIVDEVGINRATAYQDYNAITGANVEREAAIRQRRNRVAQRWEELGNVPYDEKTRIIAGEIGVAPSTVRVDHRKIKAEQEADRAKKSGEVTLFEPNVGIEQSIADEEARYTTTRVSGPRSSKSK